MRSWPSPALSPAGRDPWGVAPPVRLFDRRLGALRATDPVGPALLYVCGITPYDATHLGHAATYVGFDLLNRAWRAAGHDVTYVQNVTDVDDPLLERAAATGEDWRALAERETQLFREDMTALAVIPPEHYVGAVEAIPLIVEMIERLRDNDSVYDVGDDLYFAVGQDPAFGEVSGLDRASMLEIFPERGGDPDRPGKRDPLDCLLWQGRREGEPSWDTRLGPGRPGWHVECAAIALHHLGRTFDVQGGGSDLAFPHHEMSASQGHLAYPGERYAKLSVHAGMVGYDGHKMSKSRGNLVLVSVLRAQGVDARAIRLALLSQHYRSDWEWRRELLEAARSRLAAWTDAVRRDGPDPTDTVTAVRESMARDLDAPAALDAVDAWARRAGDRPASPNAGALVAAVVQESLGVALL